MKTVSVLIVDDSPGVGEKLHELLRLVAWIRVTGRARTVQEAEVLCRRCAPDVILLDLSSSHGRMQGAVVALGRLCPSAKRVVLAPSPSWPGEEARKLGLDAVLPQGLPGEALLSTIASLFPAISTAASRPILTPRESDVARLAAQGLSNPEISEALFISANTVKTHLAHVLQKLHLSNRVDLARFWPSGVFQAHDSDAATRSRPNRPGKTAFPAARPAKIIPSGDFPGGAEGTK